MRHTWTVKDGSFVFFLINQAVGKDVYEVSTLPHLDASIVSYHQKMWDVN